VVGKTMIIKLRSDPIIETTGYDLDGTLIESDVPFVIAKKCPVLSVFSQRRIYDNLSPQVIITARLCDQFENTLTVLENLDLNPALLIMYDRNEWNLEKVAFWKADQLRRIGCTKYFDMNPVMEDKVNGYLRRIYNEGREGVSGEVKALPEEPPKKFKGRFVWTL